ncbi:MAG: leucine-rich repeat protein, partial [Eubacterium sp.]|nr:leucine-rich repeat protein [Eubacterium sp.]
MKRKSVLSVICILLIIIIICFSSLNNVEAGSYVSSALVWYSIDGEKNKNGEKFSSYFHYSDDMLFGDANELSEDLAKVSIDLASAAYGSNNNNISSCLGQMGYDVLTDSSVDNYSRVDTYEDNDFVAFTVGHKYYNGKNIYVISVRGTPNSFEWFSDFHLTDSHLSARDKNWNSDYHYGFWKASTEIIDYLRSIVSGKDNIFLVTGHSRGAAVSNIVGGELSKSQEFATRDHIFCYTFACPAVKVGAEKYSNIHNYNNPGDAIASVPLADWGYERYGIDVPLSTDSEIYSNFKNRFKNVKGEEYAGILETDTYVSTLKTIADKRSDFDTPEHRYYFDIIAFILRGNLSDVQTVVKINLHYGGVTVIDSTSGAILRVFSDWSNNSFAVKLNEIMTGDNSLLYSINRAINTTGSYTEEEFSSWVTSNDNLCKKIHDATDVTITTRSDLVYAGQKLESELDNISYVTTNLVTLADLFVGTDNNPKASVFHAHMPVGYVLWINSMYFGYEGWCDNDTITDIPWGKINNINVDRDCFKSCDKIAEISIPKNIKRVGRWFSDCNGLKRMIINSNDLAFYDSAMSGINLESLSIPIDYSYPKENGVPFNGCSVKKVHYTKGKTGVMIDRNNDNDWSDNYYQLTLEYAC